jgi:hypothetical protein
MPGLRSLGLLLGGLALTLACTPMAKAEDGPLLSGTLEDLCRARSEDSLLLCSSYIRGSIEGLMLGQQSIVEGESSFCLPDGGVTVADVRDTFVHFVEEDTARRREMAGLVLLISLEHQYPCTEEQPDEATPPIDTTRYAAPRGIRPASPPRPTRAAPAPISGLSG